MAYMQDVSFGNAMFLGFFSGVQLSLQSLFPPAALRSLSTWPASSMK